MVEPDQQDKAEVPWQVPSRRRERRGNSGPVADEERPDSESVRGAGVHQRPSGRREGMVLRLQEPVHHARLIRSGQLLQRLLDR